MNRYYLFIYGLLLPFLKLFYPRRQKARPALPEGAAIICANHSNLADPLLMAITFGKKHHLRFMAKIELSRIPLIGWLLRKAGVYFVDRGTNDLNAVKTSLSLLKKGEKICIFPEGTRVHADESVDAKNGAVRFAMRTGVPIVPVFITRDKKLFKKIDLVVGAPYTVPKDGDMQELTEDLMHKIQALDPAGDDA